MESQRFQSGLTSEVISEELEEKDPRLPPDTAYLYVPLLQDRGDVIGLLALTRPRRHFTRADLGQLEPLISELGSRALSIRRFEELYGQVENYVEDPMAVRRALERLVAQGVTVNRMGDILALIPERAFQKRFDEILGALAEGRVGKLFYSLNDEDLRAIYNEIRSRETSEMPRLDASILQGLLTVASSLSAAFSFHHELSERDRSEMYTPLYRIARTAVEARTIQNITARREEIRDACEKLQAAKGIPPQATRALHRLDTAIAELEQSKYADQRRLRREGLKDALAELDAIEQTVGDLEPTLRVLFLNWASRWGRVISAALSEVGAGEVELDVALRSKHALPVGSVSVVLEVRNVGLGLARRVTAKLLPGTGYEVIGNGQFTMGPLQTDKTKEADFIIKPQEMDRLRLLFQVSYRDSQDAARTLDFADQFFLQGELPEYRPVDNPYIVGPPLEQDSSVFFGRDDVFEFIRRNVSLSARRVPQVLLLVGERRVGKTSVARQLPARLGEEDYIHVYFDAQKAMEPRQFLFALA